MGVREKLVELLDNFHRDLSPFAGNEKLFVVDDNVEQAEYLIEHGVTVQEWISVEDKLPPYNHNVLVYRPNMAMEILVDNYSGYYGEDDDEWHEGWALYGEDAYGNPVITHWAYFPQPPKGE